MMDMRLCLGYSPSFGVDEEEFLSLIRQIGFDGFFVEWAEGKDLVHLASLGKRLGLLFQSVHAPFGRMADMWGEDEDKAACAQGELIDCVKQSAVAGVPLVVLHPFIGFLDHSPNALGVARFAKVVEAARQEGIRVAFENVEGEEYLSALMEAFSGDETVGFCWDTGHELCYNRGKDMMALYGERLYGTHINDNLGVRDFAGEITWIDDLHLLPMDGIADMPGIARRLNDHGYRGVLTFELMRQSKPGRHENDPYAAMAPVEYLSAAYIRACRVASLVLRDRASR